MLSQSGDSDVSSVTTHLSSRHLRLIKFSLNFRNFDAEFTSEAAVDSVVESSNLSQTVQEQFIGFTYNPTSDNLQSPK
jgi:Protein kinase C terminal domain